ncbi:MAG: hypothetical protein AAF545_00790 [Pseudomonadota bacterium]
MAGLIDKLKQYVSERRVKDVAPPDAQIPTGPSRTLQPVRRMPGEAPRAGAPLQGHVRSPNNRDQVLDQPEERTEELLTLSEDALRDPDDNGMDPYNTGSFRTSGIWRRD